MVVLAALPDFSAAAPDEAVDLDAFTELVRAALDPA